MEIKPIKLIPNVKSGEIPQTKVDKNQPRATPDLKAPAGKWDFQNGQIVMNGQNVAQVIQNAGQSPGFWLQLANDLDAFRNFYLRKNAKKGKKKIGDKEVEEDDPTGELGHLSALVDAYIAKIMRLLKRKYDETADGLSFTLDEHGQLTINGMNVHSFILMARRYPSDKARLFLKGLKNRLSVILSNKSGNANYEKIRETTLALFDEIDREIKRIVEKDRLIENT